MRQMNFREELAKLTPRLRDNRPGKIYIFGAGRQRWEGLYRWYKNVVNVDLIDSVLAFVDSDPKKQGSTRMGRPVISPSEMDLENAVVLFATAAYQYELDDQCRQMGLVYNSSYFYVYIFPYILKRFVYSETAKFSRTRNGRCFILGNGPSLKVADVQRLHEAGEVCFGVNKITNIFDSTDWRPTYYYCCDPYAQLSNAELKKLACPKFLNINLASSEIFHDSVYYFEIDDSGMYYEYPYKLEFRGNIERVFEGGTSVGFALQGAVGMGFDDICLLGCDTSTGLHVLHDGTVIRRDYGEHFYAGDVKDIIPRGAPVEISILGYIAARKYCEAHGVKIRNATRGGALEVFERVDFDSLF